jgi:NAD(P)-dependent dehydrogenase (short-subunit alcohol dehydrogenase family)
MMLHQELARLGSKNKMKLVISDVARDDLEGLLKELGSSTDVIAVHADVSKADDVAKLGQEAKRVFGAPHLVFNNAGVAAAGLAWESSVKDWNWVLGINLMGVVHGINTFTPMMLEQAKRDPLYRGRIINTASMAGLASMPLGAMYNVSKHGVVTLTETLHHDLNLVTDQVKASVVCPFYVPTKIASGATPDYTASSSTPSQKIGNMASAKAVSSGKISAETVAQQIFDSVEKGDFYIFTHPGALSVAQVRLEDILARNQPRDPYFAKPEVGQRLKDAIQRAYANEGSKK